MTKRKTHHLAFFEPKWGRLLLALLFIYMFVGLSFHAPTWLFQAVAGVAVIDTALLGMCFILWQIKRG